jgi:hypothetical protein
MGEGNAQDIISRATNALTVAKGGLRDLDGDDLSRRRIGLYNLVIHGRSVTFILQGLRGVNRTSFDDWYRQYKDEMAGDEMMRSFVRLRNELEKEGDSSTVVSIKIDRLTIPQDLSELGPAPPNTKGFVIGIDGPAWLTEDAQGKEETHPVQAPKSMVDTDLRLCNPPRTHLGMSIDGKSLPELCQLYVQYLDGLLADARRHFL